MSQPTIPSHQSGTSSGTTSSTRPSVKNALTANCAAAASRTRRPSADQQRRRTAVENTHYAAFAARVIRAHGRRVAEGDVEGLAELLDLARELEAATTTEVSGLRELGYSWGEIASRLGTTRQAAHQRWGTR